MAGVHGWWSVVDAFSLQWLMVSADDQCLQWLVVDGQCLQWLVVDG